MCDSDTPNAKEEHAHARDQKHLAFDGGARLLDFDGPLCRDTRDCDDGAAGGNGSGGGGVYSECYGGHGASPSRRRKAGLQADARLERIARILQLGV